MIHKIISISLHHSVIPNTIIGKYIKVSINKFFHTIFFRNATEYREGGIV
jgi:hypothetical protein